MTLTKTRIIMKQITVIIFLMLFSLGYSQSFPLDFETPTVFTNFDGSNATLVDNPSKKVLILQTLLQK